MWIEYAILALYYDSSMDDTENVHYCILYACASGNHCLFSGRGNNWVVWVIKLNVGVRAVHSPDEHRKIASISYSWVGFIVSSDATHSLQGL